MPRKKKEVKEESNEEKVRLDNIDLIIKAISPKLKTFKEIIKYDGITIEFVVNKDDDVFVAMDKVGEVCKELGLRADDIEHNKQEIEKFILQFPDMTPKFTKAEIKKLYEYSFKLLLDDTFNNEPSVTKSDVINNKDNYVRQSITIYFRFNVNKYKERLEDYLNNNEYRQNITNMFLTYLDDYLVKRK